MRKKNSITLALNVITEEFEDEDLFPDDALSNHTDMVDNEPVINEAKRKFIRYGKDLLRLLIRLVKLKRSQIFVDLYSSPVTGCHDLVIHLTCSVFLNVLQKPRQYVASSPQPK